MPRISKKAAVQHFVRERGWQRIARPEWDELQGAFADVSADTRRSALNESGLVVEQPFAGVATKSLAELEGSLVEMAEAYKANRQECRALVIQAKDRCRFASLNPKTVEEKRAVKEEMVEWMLVWLGDPAMFADWVAVRRRLLPGPLLQNE